MLPKVSPVDMSIVVYIASRFGEPNTLVNGYTPRNFVTIFPPRRRRKASGASPSYSDASANISVIVLSAYRVGGGNSSVLALGHEVLDRRPDVDDADARLLHHFQDAFGVGVAHQEFDFDRQIARQLEEVLLVDHAVTAETRDTAEYRPAADTDLFRLLEQPLVEQDVVVLAVLVHVEPEVSALHAASVPKRN